MPAQKALEASVECASECPVWGIREPRCSYTPPNPVPPCWEAVPGASVPGHFGLLPWLQGGCYRSRKSLWATGRGSGRGNSTLSSLKGKDKGVDRLRQHLLSHLDSKPQESVLLSQATRRPRKLPERCFGTSLCSLALSE